MHFSIARMSHLYYFCFPTKKHIISCLNSSKPNVHSTQIELCKFKTGGSTKVKVTQSCSTLCDPMEFSRPEYWGGVPFSRACSNPGLPYCRQILYQLSHQEGPRILEWVAYPFSSRSSRPRNWTRVSYIAGSFFTSWATILLLQLADKTLRG